MQDVLASENGSDAKAPMRSYSYGVKKAYNESWDYLVSQYNIWKANYVVRAKVGCRVQRDYGTRYDTVSEGMGYGMLLALYFNDQETFDQLWTYVQAHLTARNRRGETVYLIHWKVDAYDNDVSEFYISVPHPKAWLVQSTWNEPYDDYRTYIARDSSPGPGYLKASMWDRKPGSATDADMDIAAALVMASKRWDNLSYGYAATNMIKAILTMIQSRKVKVHLMMGLF